MLNYLRWLLLPFSLLYGLVVMLRNWCYDAGMFKSRKFKLPVICVGNLDVGGAGKSPMTEYLVRLLRSEYKLATLSRGYGRQTKGFLIAGRNLGLIQTTATATENTADLNTAAVLGDEPAQFAQKFPDVTVAVCEKRVNGIEHLQADHDLIILDDAYQHRAVEPGFSVLLFDYNRLNETHLLLPAGNLREPFVGRYRADVFVVSKCPDNLSEQQKQAITARLKPLTYQQVFFSAIDYLPLQRFSGSKAEVMMPDKDTIVFLLTGIANAQPLLLYLRKITSHIVHHNYPDHHQFSLKNIAKLAQEFNNCTAAKKVIITTEKDAQRLREPELVPLINSLPVMVLPIGISFLNKGEAQFNKTIFNYVRQYTTHGSVH